MPDHLIEPARVKTTFIEFYIEEMEKSLHRMRGLVPLARKKPVTVVTTFLKELNRMHIVTQETLRKAAVDWVNTQGANRNQAAAAVGVSWDTMNRWIKQESKETGNSDRSE